MTDRNLPPPTPPPSAGRPATRRLTGWLARLGLAVLGPLALLLLLEGGLRLAGVGRNTDFFIPDGEPGVYRTNPRYTELFFPASFGLKALDFRLSKEKPPGHVRVFVIGESAAMGVPEPGFALAPQLRAQLQAAYPGREFDVYNLGMTAINSHVIRHLVGQAVGFHPDLLVVYMGNNEVVGPYGPGSAIGGRMLPLSLIRLGLWVQTTRTGQLVQSLVLRLAGTGRAFKDWRGMEMFAGKTVPADDPRLPEVYANFSANLADILAAARGAGVKVVLSTVAVNIRDSSPFVSLHRAGMSETDRQAWQESLDDATAAAELDDPARARASFDRALALDPDNADTHFLLAQFLGQQGGLAAARPHYLAALQQDALRFRADARINRIIRQAAATAPGEVFLVDAAQALGSDATSTGEPAGHELFFEHVHLTWAGNYALSRLLAKQTGAVLFGPGPAPGPWLDSTACAAAVGFTPFGRALMLAHMDELTDRPPFTGQRSFAAARNRLRGESDSIDTQLASRPSLLAMAEQVDAARRRDPANAFLIYHLAVIKTQLGDLAGALALNDRLLAVQPPSPEQAAQRAYLLEGLHRSGEAEAQLLASARSAPFYFQTYALLGSLWSATGQVPKALGYFAGLVARMPDSQGARLTYAQLLGVSGDEGAAERQWREILRLTPDAEAALAPLLQQLDDRHDGPAELTLLLNAFAYNPRSYANNARLLEYYDERNDLPNTVKFMQALAASGPVKAALHFDLAVRLRQLGRRNAALVEFHRARVAAQAENDQALLRDLDDPANQP